MHKGKNSPLLSPVVSLHPSEGPVRMPDFRQFGPSLRQSRSSSSCDPHGITGAGPEPKTANPEGTSQNGDELSHASRISSAAPISCSPLSQRKRHVSLLTPLHSLLVLMGGRPQAASLVRGLRPRNAPGPTTCLVDRVPVFVTGAQSSEFLRTRSLYSHRVPVGAGLVPAVAHHPIYGPRDKS